MHTLTDPPSRILDERRPASRCHHDPYDATFNVRRRVSPQNMANVGACLVHTDSNNTERRNENTRTDVRLQLRRRAPEPVETVHGAVEVATYDLQRNERRRVTDSCVRPATADRRFVLVNSRIRMVVPRVTPRSIRAWKRSTRARAFAGVGTPIAKGLSRLPRNVRPWSSVRW